MRGKDGGVLLGSGKGATRVIDEEKFLVRPRIADYRPALYQIGRSNGG